MRNNRSQLYCLLFTLKGNDRESLPGSVRNRPTTAERQADLPTRLCLRTGAGSPAAHENGSNNFNLNISLRLVSFLPSMQDLPKDSVFSYLTE